MPVKTDIYAEGKKLLLGNRIGKGGEGEVYALNDGTPRAFKLYTVSDLSQREAKIRAMVESKMAATSNLVAFSLDVALDKNGRFAGFLMNLVSNHKPLFELYSPGVRKQNFPEVDYRFLVRSAANIARAVAAVHQAGCVIGDINASGILVSSKATAALIDADSFQIIKGSTRFLCHVGTAEYTPPELQGQRLNTVVRTTNHDAFGLAVVIFQLLFMGRHPFTGTYSKKEDMPQERAIREHRFAYSRLRKVDLTPPPGVPSLEDFGSIIEAAFEAAFSPDAKRPSASNWVSCLEELENSLRSCARNSFHFYCSSASECPWCRLETRTGIVLFLPRIALGTSTINQFDSAQFNLEAIWAAIEAIPVPNHNEIVPVLPQVKPNPSQALIKQKQTEGLRKVLGCALLVAAAVLFVTIPSLFLIWIILSLYALSKFSSSINEASQNLTKQYATCQERWGAAIPEWRSRIGLYEIEQQKSSLREAKRAYSGLAADRQSRILKFQVDRNKNQLDAYLDRFLICDARIRGIGPAKHSTLRSYGIESAADVTRERVLAVQGFGEVNSLPLLDWRRDLERRFTYKAQQNQTDLQELQKIEQDIANKSAQLQRELISGAKDLKTAVERLRMLTNNNDLLLSKLHGERLQIEIDMAFLGLSIPRWSPRIAAPLVTSLSGNVISKMHESAVLRFFGAKFARRGDDYQRRRLVIGAMFDPTKSIARGQVKGRRSSPYSVAITIDTANLSIRYAQCTCPMATRCKHGAALIYELIRLGKL